MKPEKREKLEAELGRCYREKARLNERFRVVDNRCKEIDQVLSQGDADDVK